MCGCTADAENEEVIATPTMRNAERTRRRPTCETVLRLKSDEGRRKRGETLALIAVRSTRSI